MIGIRQRAKIVNNPRAYPFLQKLQLHHILLSALFVQVALEFTNHLNLKDFSTSLAHHCTVCSFNTFFLRRDLFLAKGQFLKHFLVDHYQVQFFPKALYDMHLRLDTNL